MNKYPYIKDKQVFLSPKFLGDSERSIDLNLINSFLDPLEIVPCLQRIKRYVEDQMKCCDFYDIQEQDIDAVEMKKHLNSILLIINEAVEKIKPFSG